MTDPALVKCPSLCLASGSCSGSMAPGVQSCGVELRTALREERGLVEDTMWRRGQRKEDVQVVSSCWTKNVQQGSSQLKDSELKSCVGGGQRCSSGQDHVDQEPQSHPTEEGILRGALVNLFPVFPSLSYWMHHSSQLPQNIGLYSFCLKISTASGAYKINFSAVHETVYSYPNYFSSLIPSLQPLKSRNSRMLGWLCSEMNFLRIKVCPPFFSIPTPLRMWGEKSYSLHNFLAYRGFHGYSVRPSSKNPCEPGVIISLQIWGNGGLKRWGLRFPDKYDNLLYSLLIICFMASIVLICYLMQFSEQL